MHLPFALANGKACGECVAFAISFDPIYRFFVVGRVWGGGTRHLARFPLVCLALSPPVKLKFVE